VPVTAPSGNKRNNDKQQSTQQSADPEDYAASPQLCPGSCSDFILTLHMLSPGKWTVIGISTPAKVVRIYRCRRGLRGLSQLDLTRV
jgi:hypothetical protein